MPTEKPKFNTRTLKLKLSVVAESPEEKKKAWKRIRQIIGDAWRAANWIASGQYLKDQMIRRVTYYIDTDNGQIPITELEKISVNKSIDRSRLCGKADFQ